MTEVQVPLPSTKRKTRVRARVGSGTVSNYVCVTNGVKVQRVTRKDATALIAEGWNYAPRKLWKEKVRDVEKKEKTAQSASVVATEPKKKAKKVKTDKPRKSKETK